MAEDNLSIAIKKRPYETIMRWAESRLHLMGARTFKYLALQPPSLIIPTIPYSNGSFPTKINVLILSPSGSGKTTLSEMLEKISYDPISYERITQAGLEKEITGRTRFSLIIGDVERLFKDINTIKLLEGLIGEEQKMSYLTAVKSAQEKINGVFTGFGLPSSLTKYASYGLIQRMSTIIIYHTPEERKEIAKSIADGIGHTKPDTETENIKNYYKELLKIQWGEGPIEKVSGYIIEPKTTTEIYQKWEKLIEELEFPEGKYLQRELQLAFKYMVSHSFLNIFNRKIEENKLIVSREDINLSLGLMEHEMRLKQKVLHTIAEMSGKDGRELQLYRSMAHDEKLSFFHRNIIKSVLGGNGDS